MSAIISLTTIPDRIEHIEKCLRSLVKQKLPVYLWAVEKIARSDTVLDRIPPFVHKLGVKVKIVKDCGPITKLLPALRRKFGVILTADDDCIYGAGWASGLLKWGKNIPRAAIGYRGRVLTGKGYKESRLVLKSKIRRPVPVDIITGVYGALYRRTFFDDGIFEEYKQWMMNDEFVIAAHFNRRHIWRYVVPRAVLIKNAAGRKIEPLFGVNVVAGCELNNKGLHKLGLEKRK